MPKYLTQLSPPYHIVILVSALWGITPSYAQWCQGLPPSYTLGEETVSLPCVEVLPNDQSSRQVYDLTLKYLGTDENGMAQLVWDETAPPVKVEEPGDQVGAFFNPSTGELYIPRLQIFEDGKYLFEMMTYQLTLQQDLVSGILTVVKDKIKLANNPPVAKDLVRQINPASAYQMIEVTGTDVDWDSLQFELVSSSRGPGYTFAYLTTAVASTWDAATLYVMVEENWKRPVQLLYRVFDGQEFSEPATVILNPSSQDAGRQYQLGSKRAGASFQPRPPKAGSSGQGGVNAPADLSVDLRPAFPPVGNQGKQNSCVGWSVAAVRSYQEALEREEYEGKVNGNDQWYDQWMAEMLQLAGVKDWSAEETFSPAFIYHHINDGQDGGALISDALNLVVETGVVTWNIMPYEENDVNTPPPYEAEVKAEPYRAKEWYNVVSADEVKAELSQGHPVIISMALHESFKQLQGTGALYNTTGIEEQKPLGDHAMVIVGYNNTLYGGAFNVRNSWGPEWGDQGHFWLTYADFSQKTVPVLADDGMTREPGYLVSAAYVLIDRKNEDSLSPPETPDISSDPLPDLQITNWDIQYDGHLESSPAMVTTQISCTLFNGGQTPLSLEEGVTIRLGLSDQSAEEWIMGDIWLYPLWEAETIEFDSPNDKTLLPGESLQLESTASFSLQGVPAGNYYFILEVYPYDFAPELDQDNNLVEKPVTIIPAQYNLELIYANASWLYYPEGNGQLDYLVINSGRETIDAGIGWDLQLRLVGEEVTTDDGTVSRKEMILWQQPVTEALTPLDSQEVWLKYWEDPTLVSTLGLSPPFYVSAEAPISFNVFHDVNGQDIPVGNYDLEFVVDPADLVDGNQLNNLWNDNYEFVGGVEVKDHYYPLSPLDIPSQSENRRHTRTSQTLQKLRISETPEGQRRVEMRDKETEF